jgi:drug/metabolite transporter (DMT)-like permease
MTPTSKDNVAARMSGAYVAFALLGLVWGSNPIFVKWAVAWISPAQITLLRVLFGFLPLLVFALATHSLSWRHWRYGHHFLVMSVLAMAFYYFAFAKGSAELSGYCSKRSAKYRTLLILAQYL